MKNLISRIYCAAALLTLAAIPRITLAGAPVWSGAASPDQNWTTGGNWTGTGTGTGGAPGTGDTVTFGNAGAVATPGTVNNIVNNTFTAAIGSLTYNNTASFHTTQIAAGTTLTVNGALTASGAGTNTITGAGGALTVNAPAANFVVGSSQAVQSGLDLSGLDTFTAAVKQIQVALGGSFSGTLMLARTNNITTASGSAGNSAALVIGGATSSTAVGSGRVYLGQSNALFLDGITVGSSKSSGDSMSFNAAFSSPVAYIRGISGGTSRVTKWALGDNSVGVGSGTPGNNYTNDFSAGTLNAMASTVIVGQGGNSSGTQRTTAGTFLMGAGILDVTTLDIGAIGSGTGAGSGTMVINSGTLRANSTLELGHTGGASGTTAGNTKGTLTVTNNGTVLAASLAVGANSGASIVAMTSSTLAVSNALGSSSTLLNTLAVTNSTLYLVPGTSATAYVTTLALGGSNVLNVISNGSWVTPAVISSYPVTLHIIQYSASAGGTNFYLGPLPSMQGTPLQGYLSDSGSTIDLVITNGPVVGAPTTDTWQGTLNLNNTPPSLDANWSTNSADANWLIQQTSALGAFRNLDTVIFDDSAFETNVVLNGPLTPLSVTFNNNSSNYVFTGSGSLVGVFGLTLNGTASVTLAETGLDSFNGGITLNNSGMLLLDNNPNGSISGGLTFNSGTVQVGNNDANGDIPSGGITNNGVLVFARTDTLQVTNIINGSGSLTNNGSGTLILAGANSYNGPTAINAGTVQVGNGGATGALGQSSIINNGTLVYNLSANVTVVPDISGTGPLIQNGSGRLTLNTSETYSGDTIANAGTLVLSNSASIPNTPHILINNATLDVSSFTSGFTIAPNQTLFLTHGAVTGIGLNANGATIGMTNSTFTIPVSGTPGVFAVTNSLLHFTVTDAFTTTSINVTNLVFGGTSNGITLTLPAGFQSYPIQLPVLRYTNLVLASGFNVDLTNLPAGFSGYASNNVANDSVDIVLTAGPAGASLLWSGTANPNLNWSTGGAGGNWSGLQPPTVSDSPVFGDVAVVGTQGQVDNIVDQNYTVNTLTYTNVSGFHTTQIPSGNTLTVSGLTVGGLSSSGSLTTIASMVGGGIFTQTNGALRVLNLGNGSSLATLDLSGLSNFVFSSTNVINLAVGNQSGGTLILGPTNNISLLTSGGRQLVVGGGASGNGGAGGKLYLGFTNRLSLDTLYCGGTKQSGLIAFNTGLVNPSALFRGISGGNSRVSVWSLGDVGSGSISSGTPAPVEGTNDFTAGSVNALVDLMVVGQGASGSGTKTTAAGLIFGAGTFDVNTLYIGAVGSQSSESGIGSVEVVGGTPVSGKPNLQVNTQIILGTTNVINTGAITGPISGVTGTYGTLTIDSGATAIVNTILAGGTASANNGVVVNGGSLTVSSGGVIGAASAPVSVFTLNNSTLTLTPATTVTNANVGTLNLGGTTNVINIASLPVVTYPATFTLAKYTNQPSSFNIGLGTIPAGSYGSAYITNDTTALAVELVLTANIAPPAPPVFSSATISNGSVVLSGTNGVAMGNYYVLSSTNVALPLTNWTPVLTNQFDNSGNFSVTLTNATSGGPRQFFLLQLAP
jgi:fibronectin-binding autotransporter adhesin